MAIVTANANLRLGYDQRIYQAGSTSTVSSATGGLALSFLSQFTGSITRVILSAIINTSVTDLDVGIMGLDVGGTLPTDTFLATPETISLTVNSTSANYIINLTNPVSVVKGSAYWLTFKPKSSFTGSLAIYNSHYGSSQYNGLCYSATRSNSTWGRGSIGSNVIYGNSTRWFSTDIPVVPIDTSSITASADQEYGFAFTLNSDHPAVRVKSIVFPNGLNLSSSYQGNPNMFHICKIYNSTGSLLYTFATEDTDRFSIFGGEGTAYFTNRTTSDIWLEPATKYYIMFAYSGTFTVARPINTFPYDNTLSSAGGAYSANFANRSSSGIITETATKFMVFELEINGIRFENAYSGIGYYFYSSSMFNGGLSL